MSCGVHVYHDPPEEISLSIGSETFRLRKTEPNSLRYYLPLRARQLLKAGKSLAVLSGFKEQFEYQIKPSVNELLKITLDSSNEIESYSRKAEESKTLKGRLMELKDLLDSGLIAPEEYDSLRQKALDL